MFNPEQALSLCLRPTGRRGIALRRETLRYRTGEGRLTSLARNGRVKSRTAVQEKNHLEWREIR